VRLYRMGREREARELAAEAANLEREDGFRRIVDTLAATAQPQEQVAILLDDNIWPLIERLITDDPALRELLLVAATSVLRSRLAHAPGVAELSRVMGWVETLEPGAAVVVTGAGMHFGVPRSQLAPLGLDRVGVAVEIEWERLGAADFLV